MIEKKKFWRNTMSHIKFDYSKVLDKFVAPHEVEYMQAQVTAADELIRKGTGAGSDFLGWLDLPENYDREEFDRILKAAEQIKSDSDVLVVIGIGGSYLGAKAAIDFLNHHFANLQTKEERKAPQILYAGNSISSTYLADLVEYVSDKDFSVNVISKSGTTTEPAIAKDWISSFEKKKQEIQESLFQGKTSQPQDAVATVLAVLHITPAELGSIPMAHYTSPHVCHKLFGIGGNETASPMRLGSSTYMNDPSEGRGLLELLNQQDLELENKADGESHNAFFTCFSSRVNDLNQFRLYGKEGGVEASGCCLVFNKNGDWLIEADVSVPFSSLSKKSGKDSDDLPEDGFWNDEYEKLPLYQVAYIAYKDEYIAEKKCGIWLSAPNKAFNLHQNLVQENLGSSIRFILDTNISRFGIRLKPVGNEEWHQFRLEKLKEALEELIGFFKDNSAVSDDDKEALEYVRYLFKDFAFRDEEEFRLLVIKPIDSEEIEYCETTQSVYIPYADIRNRADEVILGTNYEKTGNQRKAEVFRYRMKQKCPDVKVSRSTLPINPPNK